MRRYLRSHYLLVFGGAAIGLAIGIFVVDVQPAVIGWIVGGGLGVTAGAYLAAITSGEPLVGGGGRRQSNWAIDELYGEEPESVPSRDRNGN